jgi:hypothetical protein
MRRRFGARSLMRDVRRHYVIATDDRHDLRVYCNCLQSAKHRLALVERIRSGEVSIDPVIDAYNLEVTLLQVRKALELIAFASIAAHRDVYAKEYADFATHWNAKKLLARLEKLHPGFYPKAIQLERLESGIVNVTHQTGHELTPTEFIRLYDICSKAIHEWNPYLDEPRVLHIERPIADWMKRIYNLLSLHAVTLMGSGTVWIVEFNTADTGSVRAHPAVSMPE